MHWLIGAHTVLLCDGLPASGFQADGRPVFEHCPAVARYDVAAGTFEYWPCVPIRVA